MSTTDEGGDDTRARPELSIVIPAYNEERRLPRTLRQVAGWIRDRGIDAEIVVVENGSTDDTVGVVERFRAEHPNVRLVANVPRGKGLAVRHGMLAAEGRLRMLCDADLSMPVDQLPLFLDAARSGADVVIGSREGPGATRSDEPALRHLMGRVYNLLVKAIAVRGFEDTQCGFKMLTAEASREVFGAARLTGWGFDPEILFLARKAGFSIVEVPITWRSDADSRVRPVHDAVAMIRDLFAIRLNDVRGLYG